MQTKPKTSAPAAATIDVASVAREIAKRQTNIIWETKYVPQEIRAFSRILPGFLEVNYAYAMTIPCEAGNDRRITGFIRAIESTTFTQNDLHFETRVGISFKTLDGKPLFQMYLDDSCTLGLFNKQPFGVKGPFTKWMRDRIVRSFDW